MIRSFSSTPYIGIYSFPKSGNTWIRYIVSALFFEKITSIPDLHQSTITDAENCRIRDGQKVKFYKSHTASIVNVNHRKEIDHVAIIYIYRHPLDVFLSYVNFLRREVGGKNEAILGNIGFTSVEETIANGDIELFLDAFILYGTVQPSFVAASNWFQNVENWTSSPTVKQRGRDVRIVALKYEDILSQGVDALEEVRSLLGVGREEMERAMISAGENTKINGKFFWKQKAGNYREMLPENLIKKFDRYHGERVRALGYEI
ncbi:sulfotransferase domain-containing protein [Oricola sp.]|uniref:sulfotransferase domain-containing protein n=1 Tax=Oricola sp. TaxID=1979950 RepID=UPI003BA93E6C